MKVISISRFACSEVAELADAYIDNELLLETKLRVVGHARNCINCREWIEGTARLKRVVQAAARRQETPAHFRRELRDAIRSYRPATRRTRE